MTVRNVRNEASKERHLGPVAARTQKVDHLIETGLEVAACKGQSGARRLGWVDRRGPGAPTESPESIGVVFPVRAGKLPDLAEADIQACLIYVEN